MSSESVGYLTLVRRNRDFRYLWLGNIISLLGDWLNFVALITLILGLTASPLALSFVFIAKMLPGALASPIAGLIVDRFNRRRLMIACDVIRAVVVLGLLLVEDSGDIILAYVLTSLQVFASAVFQPAKTSSVPNVTRPEELVTANALMAASWSVMLAVGAAIGGFATAAFGPQVVFVLDSASYIVSAVLIFAARIPQQTAVAAASSLRGLAAIRSMISDANRDIALGWRRMRERLEVGRISIAKAVWALGGGGLIFTLALVAAVMMPDAPDVALGWLFAARGAGTGIGPILARRYLSNVDRWPIYLGLLTVACGAGYLTLALVPWHFAALLCVVFAHAAGGANWVMSTVILQQRSIDAYRGRIFATEWLLVMVAETLSILLAGLVLQAGLLGLRETIVLLAGLQILCGVVWVLWIRRYEPHPTS